MNPVKQFEVTERHVGGSALRVTIDGGGCSGGCGCSPPNYIMLSDGKVGLTITLTPTQVEQLREHGTLWLDGEGVIGRNALED